MFSKFSIRLIVTLMMIMLLIATPLYAIAASSGTYTPVSGVKVEVSGATDTSGEASITVKAKGSKGILGFGASAKTATIKITNESGSDATVSCLITKTNVNSFKSDKGSLTGNSFSMKMAAGEVVTFTLTTAKDANENKVVFSDFKCVAIASDAKANITYDSTKGTVQVDGVAVESGSSSTVSGGQLNVVAIPSSGCTFVGWMNTATNEVLSVQAQDSLNIPQSMDIQAVFVNAAVDAPWFMVGNCMYSSFDAALAKVGSSGTVVLMSSGVMSGNWTIPAGVNLLIPYNGSNLFRGVPNEWSLDKYSLTGSNFPDPPEPNIVDGKVYASTPNVEYRRLTMAEGAHITVNGGLEVSGQTHPLASGQWGNYAVLQMESNTSITVGSTGALYAYGYIRGNGTVTVESKGVVYEHYDVADYPPGGAGGLDPMNSAGVFGMTNYSFNNVEVPTTYYAGAQLRAYIVMCGHKIGTNAFVRTFIGYDDDSVFSLKSGSITKSLVGGRQKLTVAGDMELNRLYIKISLVNYTIDTAKTSGLPLSHNWDVTLTGNYTATLNGSLLMYAGSTVTIDNGYKLVIPSGTKLSLLDPESDPSDVTGNAVLDLNGEIQVDGGFYSSYTGESLPVIKSSQGTGKITVNALGTETTFNVRASGDNYAPVNITPAKLQNADGSHFTIETGKYAYCTNCGAWTAGYTCTACCEHTYDAVVTNPSCEAEGYTTHTCSKCGVTYTDSAVPATGHNMVAGTVVDPTCTVDGYTVYSCACGHTENRDPVTAPGHTPGAEADCENAQTCTVCGAELAPALGHDEVAHDAKAPTCTDIGWDAYVTCSRCDYTTYIEQAATNHAWDNACDTECNNGCGHTREPSHTPNADDGDCTTAVTCSVCGTVTTAAKEAHIPAEDDGDCTTAVKCVNCEQNAVAAKDAHVAGEDDGNCTTAVKCVNCEQNAVAAKEAHVAGEDDGDCTTAVKCVNCEQNAVAAKNAHVAGEDDGDCTTAVKCVNCEQNAVAAKDAHVAGEDDGDCTTAVKCVNCEQDAVAAKEAHVAGEDDGDCTTAVKCVNCEQDAVAAKEAHVAGEDDGDCTTAVKCVNCEQNAVAAKEAHVAGEDDGDCTTAVKCVNCDKIAVEANGSHTPNEDDGDCTTAITCSDCGTVTTPAKEAHTPAEGSHNCGYCGKPVTECGDYYVTYGDGYIVITNSGIAALKPSTFIQNMSVSILMERIDSLAAWVAEKGYTNALGKEYVDFCYNLGLDPNTMTAEQIANSYVLYAANNIGAMSEEEIYNLIFAEDGSGFDRAVLAYAMVTAYAYATDEAVMNELDQQYEVLEFFSTLADIVASPGFISYFESRQGEKDLAAFSATMEMICRSFESTEAVDKILSEGFASDDFIILLEEVIENYSHDCGVCGAQLTECMDDDNNHKCDLCDETLSECADDNNDHKCDVCDATLSECADDDNNHECDICQTAMGEHSDGDDNDHLCDYGCGEVADEGHHGGNATCTEQAICEECGERYGNRLDHTPGDAAVQNIFNGDTGVMPSYDSVTYCTVCGEEVERTTVTLPQNIFAGSTMALNDSLEFSFVTFTDMLPEGAYAMIVRAYADGTQDVVYKYTTVEGDWNPYRNNSMLAFTYGNLAAKHMADAFYAVVYNAEGEIIGVRADSMRDYAMRQLQNAEKVDNAVAKRLFVDLLKYGAAAQLHFNYGTEDLADSRLTEQQLAYTELASAGQNEQNKGGFIGNAVSLESRIELNFVCSTTLVTRDMRAVFTYTNRSGNLVTVEVAGEDFVNYRNNTMWGLTIAMPLAECAQDVTCTVYDGDQIVITGTDSVEGYLARQYNSAPIMAATWTFIESARAYFQQ